MTLNFFIHLLYFPEISILLLYFPEQLNKDSLHIWMNSGIQNSLQGFFVVCHDSVSCGGEHEIAST